MTQPIKALIFGPGLHSSGVHGTLKLSALGLEAQAGEQTQRAALNALQLREVGFGKPGVELAWQVSGEHWAVHVLDANEAQQLLALPVMVNLPQVQALKSDQRRGTVGRTLGWSLLGLFVLLPLLLLLLFFSQADRIAGWVADQIPIEQETKFGREAFDSMKAQLKLQDSGPAYEAVNEIGKRLTQGSKYNYEFHVVRDDTLNAFAMPGGIVVVHTGLIKATKRPEELAGVLAHEVQHVEQRHSVEGIVKQMGLQALWLLVTGDIGSSVAGQAALQLSSLKFSRDAESEADDKGFDALVKAGIDPSGMPDFFKTMSEKAADAPVSFISTHPLSEDRQKKLTERAKNFSKQEFQALAILPWPP
ncbi:MAG: M48 family metallopeptidase [Steroidobacteraceae bacterium]